MPRRNATGVVCIFLIWGIDDVCIVLFSVKPLTVMCAGPSLSLVLIVVFLVVRDRSKRKVPRFLEHVHEVTPRSRHRRSPMTGIDTTAPDTGVRQRVVVRTPPHRPSTSMQFGVISPWFSPAPRGFGRTAPTPRRTSDGPPVPPPDGAPLRASKFRRSGRGRAVVPAFRGSRRDATRALSFGFRRRVLSSDATYTPSRDRIGYQPPPPPGRRTPSIVVSMLVDPVSTPPPDRTSSPAAAAASSEPMPTLAGAPARKCRLADHPERRVLDPPRYPGSV